MKTQVSVAISLHSGGAPGPWGGIGGVALAGCTCFRHSTWAAHTCSWTIIRTRSICSCTSVMNSTIERCGEDCSSHTSFATSRSPHGYLPKRSSKGINPVDTWGDSQTAKRTQGRSRSQLQPSVSTTQRSIHFSVSFMCSTSPSVWG